ncbi:hypothetical protein [Paenibacillus sp. NPDC057934]|uniref:hypothetical protein n=1 Tax=Paenibacillus sp. NPDC057934 TaxID=3346282 RepID=UPI0036DC71FD
MGSLAASRESVEQDFMIEQLKEKFQITVLWSEGRACLEYDTAEQLEKVSDYVREHFDRDLLDVFFTAVECLPEDE